MTKTIKNIIKKVIPPAKREKLIYLYTIWKHKYTKPKPVEIIIDISAACNATCPFCPRIFMDETRVKGFMSEELYRFTLTEAKKHGITYLRLYSTAEPTMHPKFSEFINIAKEMGFFIIVSTNASLMNRHFDALLTVDVLQYSIEGWDKDSYEFYRQPLKFDKVFSNIKKLDELLKEKKQHTPKRSTNLLLTKETNIEKYIALWGDYVDELGIHFMFPTSAFGADGVTKKQNQQIDHLLYDFEKIAKNKYCGYPFTVVTVAFDGKISLCCEDFSSSLPLGHITDGIDKIYHSPEINKIRQQFITQKFSICDNCNVFLVPKKEDKEKVTQLVDSYKNATKAKILFY